MKSKGVKMLSCTLAAGVLATSIPFAALAAPISGVVGMASTDTATVQENSYSTLSGVSPDDVQDPRGVHFHRVPGTGKRYGDS